MYDVHQRDYNTPKLLPYVNSKELHNSHTPNEKALIDLGSLKSLNIIHSLALKVPYNLVLLSYDFSL